DLSRGCDCRSRVRAGAALFDGDGRRQAFNEFDIRLFHFIEELPRISRETLNVSPLSLSKRSIKSERGFSRATQAGNNHQLLPWNFHVQILQIMLAGTANFDNLRRHSDEECPTYQSSTAVPFLQRNCV